MILITSGQIAALCAQNVPDRDGAISGTVYLTAVIDVPS